MTPAESETTTVLIDQWVLSLHANATLTAPQTDQQRAAVTAAIAVTVEELRQAGLNLTVG